MLAPRGEFVGQQGVEHRQVEVAPGEHRHRGFALDIDVIADQSAADLERDRPLARDDPRIVEGVDELCVVALG